jgi:hypothetical protein
LVVKRLKFVLAQIMAAILKAMLLPSTTPITHTSPEIRVLHGQRILVLSAGYRVQTRPLEARIG